MPDINPYQPPSIPPTSNDDSCRLTFDGEITEADYVDLLPQRETLVWLLRVLVLLLVPAAVMSAVWAWSMFAMQASPTETLISVGITGFVFLTIYVAARTIGSKYRGRRNLRRNQDMLGRVRGSFDENGMVYFDGLCSHWMGPTMLCGVNVSENGIRVSFDTDPYRYLALTARMFDDFNVKSAERLKRNWLHATATNDSSDDWRKHPFGQESGAPWTPESVSQQLEFSFSGDVTSQTPMRSPELKSKATVETFTIFAIAGGAAIAWYSDKAIITFICLFFAAVSVWNSIQYWRNYFYGTQTHSWFQSGWVGNKSIAVRNEFNGTLMQREMFCSASLTEDLAILVGPAGVAFYLPRDQIEQEEDWKRLSGWVDAINATEPSASSSVP